MPFLKERIIIQELESWLCRNPSKKKYSFYKECLQNVRNRDEYTLIQCVREYCLVNQQEEVTLPEEENVLYVGYVIELIKDWMPLFDNHEIEEKEVHDLMRHLMSRAVGFDAPSIFISIDSKMGIASLIRHYRMLKKLFPIFLKSQKGASL